MSRRRVVIGIDPGKSGAVVALDDLGVVVASAMAGQWVLKGTGPSYVPRTMADFLTLIDADLVVIETQSTRPGQSHAVVTGYGWGLWVGIAAALNLAYVEVSPARWTRAILAGAPGEGKARSIAVARSRVPGIDLTPGRRTKPHDGLADAACLALYGHKVLSS